MLLKFFPNLRNRKLIDFFNKFFHSIFYIIFVGILTCLSALIGIEIPVYIAIAIIAGLIPVLFCDDMTSTIAPLTMFYCTFSLKHSNSELNISAFENKSFLIPLIVIAAFIGVILLTRLIFDLITNKEKKGFPRLTIGFGVLAVFLICGGSFSKYFVGKSLIMSVLEIVCLCVVYFYLYYSINWKKLNLEYVFKTLIVFGLVLFVQAFITYFITKDYAYLTERNKLIFGWGRRTNMGGLACMLVGVPFYFIYKNRFPILNSFLAVLLFCSVIASQSRGPILTASIIFIIAFVVSVIKANEKTRIRTILSLFAFIAITLGIVKIFSDSLYDVFRGLIRNIFELDTIEDFSNHRIDIYKDGLTKFAEYPVFGTGWYSCNAPVFTKVLVPARWHNTIIQCLATGGIFMLLAYLYHRFETVWLLFRKNKRVPLNKFFLYLPILALIISSMFDCFMFNLGPGLIYGVLLVSIEKGEDDNITLFGRNK